MSVRDSVQVNLYGQMREIRMPFNQLNRLTYLVGDVENLHTVMLNPEMREAILVDMLTVREKGKAPQPPSFDDIDLTQDDALLLLDFAQEHLLDFFVRAAEKANQLVAANKVRVELLNSTPTRPGQGT